MRRLFAPFAVFATLGAFLLGVVARRYVVASDSMLQAYRPGQRVLAEMVSYRLRSPRIGEVVVVRLPRANGKPDLKRIAGVPGSAVTIRDEERVLGPDEWFVLGDNLEASIDSRRLGPVRLRDIRGRVWKSV